MASNWRTLHEFLHDTPKHPGCYAIFFDGVLKYLGQTRNLKERLNAYRIKPTYGGTYTSSFGTCKAIRVKYRVSRFYGDWAMVELRMIRRLQPEFNRVGRVYKRLVP